MTDCKEDCIEVRALMSSWTAGFAFDLRCEVREKTIDFLQREYPRSLPRRRQQVIDGAKETIRETDSGAAARRVHNHA